MGTKHKAHKETLDRGYATEWNDDHILDFSTEIDTYICLRVAALNACWDFAQTGGGTNPNVVLVGAAGEEHAFVTFNTGGVTGQTSSMRKELAGAVSDFTSPLDLPILTFTLQVVTVHTVGKVVEVGLIPSATGLFTANQDGAYFRIEDNTIRAVTGTGAAETVTDLGAFNEYGHYRIEILSTSVKFYIDDMENAVATHTTNLPDNALTIKASIQSQNNVDSTMRMDACAIQILRKQ